MSSSGRPASQGGEARRAWFDSLEDPGERYLEGAACHGCLFIAECACERFNRYLDRALVIPTLQTNDAAFFAGI